MTDSVDVVVIGGGPGGAAAATLVAQKGHRVLLLERAPEPRFKIGESLMPATWWTLERLGVLEKLKASPFVRKHSVQFFGKSGKPSAPFYFQEADPHESSVTWQVLRSEFDALLLDNAQEHGVEVRRGAAVKDVLFEGDRAVGVDCGDAQIAARVVVDATGQSAFLARKLGLLQRDPGLRKASVFTHFKGALRDTGIDEGATLVIHTADASAWFWYIPLPDDRVSVGWVGAPEVLAGHPGGDPQAFFDQQAAACGEIRRRLLDARGARQVLPIQVLRDFSYRSSQIAGDGWVLVGDAFGFLDPIYSSGVFLALQSGALAADSINAALATDDPSAERLGAHGPGFVAGMEAMRKLVYAFYEPEFSFAKFLARHPGHRGDITHLLVGNLSRPSDRLFAAMREMVRLPDDARLAEPAAIGGPR